MGILNRIVVGTAPWMPKFVVGRIAAVYVAGDKLEDGINLVRKLNVRTQTLCIEGETSERKKDSFRGSARTQRCGFYF